MKSILMMLAFLFIGFTTAWASDSPLNLGDTSRNPVPANGQAASVNRRPSPFSPYSMIRYANPTPAPQQVPELLPTAPVRIEPRPAVRHARPRPTYLP